MEVVILRIKEGAASVKNDSYYLLLGWYLYLLAGDSLQSFFIDFVPQI
jgi:hypothetical protein